MTNLWLPYLDILIVIGISVFLRLLAAKLALNIAVFVNSLSCQQVEQHSNDVRGEGIRDEGAKLRFQFLY